MATLERPSSALELAPIPVARYPLNALSDPTAPAFDTSSEGGLQLQNLAKGLVLIGVGAVMYFVLGKDHTTQQTYLVPTAGPQSVGLQAGMSW